TGGYFRFDLLWIDVERLRLDVGKDRYRTQPGDDARSREEGIRRCDDFITGFHSDRHECDEQRIGPRRNADSKFALRIVRDLALEGGDLRAQNEMLGIDHTFNNSADFTPDCFVLSFEVE